MAGTDSYGQGVVVAALSDAPNAETLARNLADAIVQLTVMRFNSASARAATIAAPLEGMTTWLKDTNLLYVYDGTQWVAQPTILMDWTPLSSLGSFASGFSASTPAPRMRKLNLLGTEVWEYEGRINASALSPATTTTIFTFSAGHRPVSGRGFAVYNSSHYAARLTITQTGPMSVSVPSEAGSGVSTIYLDGVRITNPAV